MAEHPPVIVHPPTASGGRRVTIRGVIVGLAHGRGDVAEFLRRAGVEDPDDLTLDNPDQIEWRGGDMDHWPAPTG
ncbi:hypothetical protein [Streptomyces buecherae]|uniref:Uncharacterized protein n=1 Tax=Streptomyces buecherae TaxID=2763006 RepID=A0A7H8N6P8_9ACTN|nr:hypothetical protein [Streptomyces buecherae]QKW50053.1 hypothetical protein HUT08_11395 [Streptomyces buecherae]